MKYAEELGKTVLFRDLPPAELEKLGRIAKDDNLAPETELFREGQELKELFIIVIGSVRVLKKDKQGNSEELTTLGTGSYVGEVELVRPDRHAAATIETIEKSTVISMPYEQIEKLCEDDQNLAVHFYRAIAKGLARRLAHTDEAVAYYRMMAVRKRG